MPYPYYPANQVSPQQNQWPANNGVNYPNYAQQPSMVSQMPGRYINDVSEVMANEVPMDGGISVFPTRDGRYIFIKSWRPDGTISTNRYILDNPTEAKTSSETDYSARFESLEQRLIKLEQRSNRPYKSNKPYKQRENDEVRDDDER